ncbi:MAG TPA: hypothetical protein VGQ17_04405 [Gemmatimonadales bacterium]|jgi:hypothetical protein|nr:hypothetical protein [Gemmatimonadales bacterium]
MPLPTPQDQHIPLPAAAALTRAYRAAAGPTATRACLFLRQFVAELMAQPRLGGVRVYFGRDATGQTSLVMVGVDQDGNDVTAGTLLFNHFPCPPFCDERSALNG